MFWKTCAASGVATAEQERFEQERRTGMVPVQWEAVLAFNLLAQAKTANQFAIAINVRFLQVIEELAPLVHQPQQSLP